MKNETPHCHIDQSRCEGCGLCTSLCPMDAIGVEDGKASIDAEECVECGVCTRSWICPHGAIQQGVIEWPRRIRAMFSNPLAKFKDTPIYGRGTEEMKTNDSQDLYPEGKIGVISNARGGPAAFRAARPGACRASPRRPFGAESSCRPSAPRAILRRGAKRAARAKRPPRARR